MNTRLRLLHHGAEPFAHPFPPEQFCHCALVAPNEAPEAWTPVRAGETDCLEALYGSGETLIYISGATSSTFDIANLLASQKALPVWGSVLAHTQHAGRGQLGRSWFSEAGNLFANIRLPLEGPFAGQAAAPFFGCLMAETLNSMGYPVRVKWPNDLIMSDAEGCWRKVGGLLLEERQGALTAGVGLNLVAAPDENILRQGHAMPAGSLATLTQNLPVFSVFCLWQQLVARIKVCYERITDALPHRPWTHSAEPWLAFTGQNVRIVEGTPPRIVHQGLYAGINPDGSLKLVCVSGEVAVDSGSLVPATPKHPLTQPF